VLGNSGKPVTLETSSLTKFLRYVFRDKAFVIFMNLGPAKPRSHEHVIFRNLGPGKPWSREHAIFRNLGSAKPRSRGHAIFGNLESAKPRSHEHAKVWNLEPAKSRTSEDRKFRNLSEVWFGSRKQENSRTSCDNPPRKIPYYRLRPIQFGH
jgi:hypothetical protein